MKKEIDSSFMSQFVNDIVEDVKQIDARNINVSGIALSVGTKFAILKIANFKETANIPAYQGLIICLENGKNLQFSIKNLKGSYFKAEAKNGILTNVPQTIETVWHKSGQNLLEFVNSNKDKVFIVKDRFEYDYLPYGKESEQITRKGYLPIFDYFVEQAPEQVAPEQ